MDDSWIEMVDQGKVSFAEVTEHLCMTNQPVLVRFIPVSGEERKKQRAV
jgi:hypothetical protein